MPEGIKMKKTMTFFSALFFMGSIYASQTITIINYNKFTMPMPYIAFSNKQRNCNVQLEGYTRLPQIKSMGNETIAVPKNLSKDYHYLCFSVSYLDADNIEERVKSDYSCNGDIDLNQLKGKITVTNIGPYHGDLIDTAVLHCQP